MRSDYRGIKPKKSPHVFASFRFALAGLWLAIKEERNLRIHITMAVIVCILGLYTDLSITEWIIIVLTIGWVITLELVNSSLERAVDLSTETYHPLAKAAKDMAAAAVILSSIFAVIIGLLIFLPKLFGSL